ncbi:NAD(P)H-binding protein [Micromonospora sp. NPDC049274]|uniref:NAD(P)H-binding protein n=1 Tax=Micromonospora sp. NPDC049274 TaxID=3154829 RepID=UPI003428551C
MGNTKAAPGRRTGLFAVLAARVMNLLDAQPCDSRLSIFHHATLFLEQPMILVTAATAPVGRSIVERLVLIGVPVRALTRHPQQVDLPAGAEVVAGDMNDPASLAVAVKDVDGVFVLAMGPGVPELIEAAKNAGVKRVVFQSTAEIDDNAEQQPNDIAVLHHGIEQAIIDSGMQWTFLRLDLNSADALHWAFDVPGQLAGGDVVRGPFADAAGSPIHPADLAAIAVVALTQDGHSGQRYHVTGPQSLTHREQIELIGKTHGRELRYKEIDPAAARAEIAPHAPADLLFATWEAHVNKEAPVTDAIERITGRAPRSMREWAEAHPA